MDARETVQGSYLQKISQPNALALEYQRIYGTAGGDLDLTDFVNNPAANGVCSILGLGFSEEPLDLPFVQVGSLLHDGADALLVAQDRIKALTK